MLEETTSLPDPEHWQIQGEARLLIRSLARKFGTVDEYARTTICQLDSDALLDCIERLATAKSVAEVLPPVETALATLPLPPVETPETDLTVQAESPLPTVQRTPKGLTITDTRLTLYDILDYLKQQWSPVRIQQWFRLTPKQMSDILAYIDQQPWEVEAEYRQVLEYAETKQQYWREVNRSLQKHTTPSGRTEFWTTLRKRQLERRQY